MERRLVTVLFADLVGFTSASEGRDAEATRELLSRYFELARALIDRYGGTLEKFIGDAVMAVWGAPVATEDDAERAVRAAMDFVASVPDLDPTLRLRAGVLTGEAAVTIGAEGQGMVAGDMVNTAARIQSAAQPGTVLVGESTRRATERAIVYEGGGTHQAKGKSEPLTLWRALRVVSGVGGTLKSAGLEAPFVGRDRDLTLVKSLFHGSSSERRAHLVSLTGIAGIGKSRLLWEFYKYFDGIVEQVWWHRGRCLAYGEGVAYWALADMVRMRCRIGENAKVEAARAQLAATLHEHVLDEEERAFIEPRLAQLLGLDESAAGDRQDLFAAWRLFFERLADRSPVILAFEDIQWADMGLLDFIEYLLQWSPKRPLFVITIGRPELHERRPGWGAGQRAFSSLYLEPLEASAMEQLLEGLVPGLPKQLRQQILDRAQGVPLYAMETVRMLLDRGVLVQEGSVYVLVHKVETLEVPETLHALIAARLDGLSAEERRVTQDAAVLGKAFALPALAALARLPIRVLEPLLTGLVRKEVLGLQSDPRSPERGQYTFLQDLVRHIAYETLARRERYTRHLAAAEYLEQAFEHDEIAEVLAAHYVAAAEAVPDSDDAARIRTKACEMLTRAGERAGSLGAPREGWRFFEQAAALAEDVGERARLHEHAARLAVQADERKDARDLLELAISAYAEVGDARGRAAALAVLGDIEVIEGRLDVAAARMQEAIEQIDTGVVTPELTAALAGHGRLLAFANRLDEALPLLERALLLAERLARTDLFVDALISKGVVYTAQNRLRETRALLETAVALSREEQLVNLELRALNNLAAVLEAGDRYVDSEALADRMGELARRRGDRRWELLALTGRVGLLFMLGRWEEAVTCACEVKEEVTGTAMLHLADIARLLSERGETVAAEEWLGAVRQTCEDMSQLVGMRGLDVVQSRVLRAQGRPAEALKAAERAVAALRDTPSDVMYKLAVVDAAEAAFAMADLDRVEQLLVAHETLDRGLLPPFLTAQLLRLRARLAAARGEHDGVDERFAQATTQLRGLRLTFYLATTQLEHAEWLVAHDRGADAAPLLDDARATFERLRARPWLERTAAVSVTDAVAAHPA